MLTLAVALGANTALFSVADAFLLRSLPYPHPDRLLAMFERQPGSGERAPVSAPDFLAWKDALAPAADLAAFRPWGFALSGAGEPERFSGARVSANLFSVLGVQPVVGRTFDGGEDVFGAPHVAIVSHRIWQERLGGASTVAGRTLILNGTPYAIVGVMPPDVRLPEGEVWTPLAFEPYALAQRGTRALTVIARLRDGVPASRAEDTLRAVARDLSRRFPDANGGWGVQVVGLHDFVAGAIEPTVMVLWGAVALVLLIACANTAGLMLARAGGRRRQIAICRAIGASRSRLIRDLLAESVVLSMLAAIVAVPIAMGMLSLVVHVAPPELSRLSDVTIDVRVLLFTGALSIATGLLFGIVPAVRASREDLSPLLRTAGVHDPGHARLRHAAVACQVAIAVLVLVCAGLLARSFTQVQQIDVGFDPARVLTLSVSTERPAFFDDALREIRTIPGVEKAGTISHLPLAGAALISDASAADRPVPRRGEALLVNYSAVGGEWTSAIGMRVLRGRAFDTRDGAGSTPVAIVSQTLARRFWGDADPVGRRIVVGGTSGASQAPLQIVGVVAGVRSALEASPPYQVYVPHAQNPWPTMSLAVRTAGQPEEWAKPVRAAIARVDPNQAVYNVRSYDAILARARATRKFQALIVILFAIVAALLAGIGVYGVVAYTVRLRSAEIGVRLALGASSRRIVATVMSGSLRWSVAGLAAGLAIAAGVSRFLAALLYGVTPADPITYAGMGGAMIALVIGACAAAARRATAVDPLACIRGE